MLSIILTIFAFLYASNAQSSTNCQILSYYGQQVQCPQPKNSQYYYSTIEIFNICSMCSLTSPTSFASNDVMRCCPQNYVPTLNGTACSCDSSNQPSLICANCGYIPQQRDRYCFSESDSYLSTFNQRQWACPSVWHPPARDTLGWLCSCGSSGVPCFGCTTSISISSKPLYSSLIMGVIAITLC